MLEQLTHRACRVLQFGSCCALAALVLVTSSDVVARYAFQTAVPDAVEISGMLLGICISLALPAITASREHVAFDIVLTRVSSPVKAVQMHVANALVVATLGTIAWQMGKKVLLSAQGGDFIGSMEIPIWPAKAVFATGCLVAALVIATPYVAALVKSRK